MYIAKSFLFSEIITNGLHLQHLRFGPRDRFVWICPGKSAGYTEDKKSSGPRTSFINGSQLFTWCQPVWCGTVGSLKFHFLLDMSSRDREITGEMRFRWVFLRKVRHFSLAGYYGNRGQGILISSGKIIWELFKLFVKTLSTSTFQFEKQFQICPKVLC